MQCYNFFMDTQEIKKILILRLSALGDTIHTLPVAYAIKKSFPDCKLGWIVEDKAQLFIKDNPLVDKCYVIPKKMWKKRGFSIQNIREFFNIIKEINEEHYDVVLDVQQLFKSAALLPFLNIKRKITLSGGREFSSFFSNEIYPEFHKLFDPEYHVVKRNLELASHIGADTSEIKFVLKQPDETVKNKVSSLLDRLDKTKKTVVCSPATTWDNKHWNESYWSRTLDFLKGRVNIVITGTFEDAALIDRIVGGSSLSPEDYLNLTGNTNLEELAEVFRNCDVVISPDSGSAHIAWAVDVPFVVSLFSATAEKRSAPFGDKCYVLAPQLDCRPCSKRSCQRKTDKNLCCSLVKPEQLINLLVNILQLG